MADGRVAHDDLAGEVARRRTFAIISHPDAGKTTLTEKLLLYGGAVDLAGAVRSRKGQRNTTSDFMAIERQRGISISTAALQIDVRGYRLNLLDTPGHQDFSEDTYRTLMAVDSAVMVLDGARGIEAQTKKLFEVCRMRHIPIITFINKMDAPARDPLDLLDEIHEVLGLDAVPMNWPVGEAPDFQGIYDLSRHQVILFSRTKHGERRAPVSVKDLHDPSLESLIGSDEQKRLAETAELLKVAAPPFDRSRFALGEVTPVYFGSALNNFGVEPFLESLLELAPAPGPRRDGEAWVEPTNDRFTGFVFKIQANMDPRHRDQIAFVRVCSGRFERDMVVQHSGTGRPIRLSRPHRLFGGDRVLIDEACPGDVIGISTKGVFAIGDCLAEYGSVHFDPIPRFQPEHFAYLKNSDIAKYKQFNKGLRQLEAEGAIQVFYDTGATRREPILAAVGELQFDVVISRLEIEFGVDARIERLPYSVCRRIEGAPQDIEAMDWPIQGCRRVEDLESQPVALFESEWMMRYCLEKNPSVTFVTWG